MYSSLRRRSERMPDALRSPGMFQDTPCPMMKRADITRARRVRDSRCSARAAGMDRQKAGYAAKAFLSGRSPKDAPASYISRALDLRVVNQAPEIRRH